MSSKPILNIKTSKDSYFIKIIFEIIPSYLTTIHAIFDLSGIIFRGYGSKNYIMFDFFIPASRFDEYMCNERIDLDLNVATMNSRMKSIKKKHTPLLFYMDKEDLENKQLNIISYLPNNIIDKAAIHLSNATINVGESFECDFIIDIPIQFWQESIKNTTGIDCHRKILMSVKNGELKISAENDKMYSRGLSYKYSQENNPDETLTMTFSYVSLFKLQKLGSIIWEDDMLHLHIRKEGSLSISSSFSSKDDDDTDEKGSMNIVLCSDELINKITEKI